MPKYEMELTEEQIKKLEDGKQIRVGMPAMWKPNPANQFCFNYLGQVMKLNGNYEGYASMGMSRATEELAERAIFNTRVHNQLMAYRDQVAPDYVPNWGDADERKWFVHYHVKGETWVTGFDTDYCCPGVTYFPFEVAEALVDKLNNKLMDWVEVFEANILHLETEVEPEFEDLGEGVDVNAIAEEEAAAAGEEEDRGGAGD